MQGFTDTSAGQNPLITVLAQTTQAIKDMPDAKREQLRAQAERIVATQVYPAYKRATALLEWHLPQSTDDAGLRWLKGVPEAYAFFLRRYTTTDLTPDQIQSLACAN
jgi:uncharacterized protein (DUF885 family)